MATSSTPSGSPDKDFLIKVLKALGGILLALGGGYAVYHDTPPLRAGNEAIYLANQGKEQDVALAKEKTKQMKLEARSQGVYQPQGLSTPVGRPSHIVTNEGQHFLAHGMDFTFDGQGDVPSAVIGFRQPPVATTGAFKIYGMGKTVWNDSWSTDPSPYPLEQLFQEVRSYEGSVKWMEIYTNGPVTFKF